MSTMTRVDYPTENGVEVRTMGQSLRPIRLYFEVHDSHKPYGERGHEHDSSLIGLTARMFAVDVEGGAFQLIPSLGRIHFDPSAVPGMIGGRLERIATDVITTDPVNPFVRGYMREHGHGVEPRTVSEPFMLFGVVTLGREQFEEQKGKALDNYHAALFIAPAVPKGAWD
jgi:hypothetical protein